MSVYIASPKGGDVQYLAPPQYLEPVQIWNTSNAPVNVYVYIGPYSAGPVAVPAMGIVPIPVPIGASGTYRVSVTVGGVEQDFQANVKLIQFGIVVMAGAKAPPTPPDPIATLLRPGVYEVSGSLSGVAGAAYIVAVAYEESVTGVPTPIGGVAAMPDADGSWAVEFDIAKNPNKLYYARVTYYDASDEIALRYTVVFP